MSPRRKGQQVLLVGPGWLGQAIADALAADGAAVWTLRRSAASTTDAPPAPGGVIALKGDIRAIGTGTAAVPPWVHQLPDRLDAIVVCVAPSRGAGDDHAGTYPAALEGALRLAERQHCPLVLYTSSTGVYGRTDGGESRESDLLVERDPRQGALLRAERVLMNDTVAPAVSRIIVRVAGLYGPGRDPAPRFRGSPPPTGDDDVWCNFSWRDDVVTAIDTLIPRDRPPASLPSDHGATRIYNCADGTPLRASTIARALGAPESIAIGAVASPTRPVPPSGRSNQRIVVDALRSTGWTPRMTTVFDGLRALGHTPQTGTG